MAKSTNTPPGKPVDEPVDAAPAKLSVAPAKPILGRPKLAVPGGGKKRPEVEIDPVLVFIGKIVFSRRTEMGLTQHELAVKAKFNTTTVFMVEAGRQNMTVKSLLLLAEALNLQVGDLFPRSFPLTPAAVQEIAQVLTDSSNRIAVQLQTIDRYIAELNQNAAQQKPARK